jgi:hypothetical protein
LWRTTVHNSVAGNGLLNVAACAQWASQARQLLADWRIDTADLRLDSSHSDYPTLAAWICDYSQCLADHGWRDEPSTLGTLTPSEKATPGVLTLVDPYDLTPAQEALFADLEQAGWSIQHSFPAGVAGHGSRTRLPDAKQELESAAQWAFERVDRDPHSRTALVIPNVRGRLADTARTLLEAARTVGLGDAHKYIGLQYQAALHTKPLVAAALDGIDLLSELGTFVTLSRWLRSPFFCSETHEQARAAAIEARLRNNMAAQLPFLVAYEQGGLRFQLERDAPEFAMKVAEALREARMGGPVNSPSQWGRACPPSPRPCGRRA